MHHVPGAQGVQSAKFAAGENELCRESVRSSSFGSIRIEAISNTSSILYLVVHIKMRTLIIWHSIIYLIIRRLEEIYKTA